MVYTFFEKSVCGAKARVQWNYSDGSSAKMQENNIEFSSVSLPLDVTVSENVFPYSKKRYFQRS